MHRRVLALALAGFACGALLAAQEAEPDRIDAERPDFTNGTGIVAPGGVQVETGYTFTRRGDDRRHTLGEMLVRAGVGHQVETRLVLNSYDWSDGPDGRRQGLEDPALEMKVRLTDEAEHRPKGLPAVAVFLATTVPAGARSITADAWQPTAKLALDWHLSQSLDLSSNLAFSRLADGGRRFDQVAASLSLGVSWTEEVGSFFEVYGFSRESADGTGTAYVDSGVTYAVTRDFQVDARVGVGLRGAGPSYFAGVGAAVRW